MSESIKKILGITLLCAILFSACQTAAPEAEAEVASGAADSEAAVEESVDEESAEMTTEEINIAYMTVQMGDPIWRVLYTTIEDLANQDNVQLDFYDANNDPQAQVNQVDTVIAKEPDAVIISPVDSAIGGTLVEKIKAAGIPVVTLLRPATNGTPTVAVMLSNEAVGKAVGEYLVEVLTARYGTPKGVYLEVQGDIADALVGQFDDGFQSVVGQYPEITGVVKPTKWDLGLATTAVEDVLSNRDDIDAVWLQSDYFIPAVESIIQQHSAAAGEDGHIIVIGCAGETNALDAIGDGWMDATINMPQNDAASLAYDFALQLARGETVSEGTIEKADAAWSPAELVKLDDGSFLLNLPPWPVDASNVQDPNLWGNLVRVDE